MDSIGLSKNIISGRKLKKKTKKNNYKNDFLSFKAKLLEEKLTGFVPENERKNQIAEKKKEQLEVIIKSNKKDEGVSEVIKKN